MQAIDLGLCTGDALCYVKDYEHRQDTSFETYVHEGAWSVKLFVTNGTVLIVY